MNKVFIYIIFLAIIDVVIPIPIMAAVVLYALIEKPQWARDLVKEFFGEQPTN